MIKVTIEAQLPEDPKWLFAYLDWIRTFDRTWPNCQFRVFAEGGNQSMADIWKMFEALGLDVKFAQRTDKP
jgi:hypothetical protein